LTGKTTLANDIGRRLAVPVFHTDQVSHMDWIHQPQAIIRMAPLAGIIEGVQVLRAVRKGLFLNWLVVLDKSLGDLTDGQQRMTTGLQTILKGLIISKTCPPLVRCARVADARSFLEDVFLRG
jgi:hypothetical protein